MFNVSLLIALSEAEMGLSPSQESFQTGNYSSPKQTTSEHTPGCSEPSERKHQLDSEVLRNVPGETSTVVSSHVINENLQPVSEDVTYSSFTEHLGPPPEDASKGSQTNKSSCAQQTSSEQTHEFRAEFVHNDPSEKNYRLDSEIVQNEPGETSTVVSRCLVNENLSPFLEGVSKNSLTENVGLLPEDSSKNSQTDGYSLPELNALDQALEVGSGSVHSELDAEGNHSKPSAQNNLPGSDITLNEPEEISNAVSICIATKQLGPPPDHVTKNSAIEPLGLPPEEVIKIFNVEQLGPPHEELSKTSCLEKLETPPKNAVKNAGCLTHRYKRTSKSLKKRYMLRSLRGSDRVLRSRLQEKVEKPKAPESNNNAGSAGEKKRLKKKKKKIRVKGIIADEYSRIRKHLRYLLNRVNYEQSLIAAYSGEGWKGLSLEKLKPEKELQRATSEIIRRKLKIRDLFQRLDSLCAEGSFPESLFDSEGQISSEDIFCAKCGSKDLSGDNDIILCDGACDRGFHQFCLEPPLLKEDIPPDDEGWLCPGCDCKVDCIDLLNDSQGTNLSINDNWKKVFPEAAAAAAGDNREHNFALPSDGSDDDGDYDPDSPEIDEKEQGDESSSDESDFTSASDDLEALPNDGQYLGLPSDDSEDDDFDPDAPDLDGKVKQESSSSDFTSDSEDLGAAIDDNISSGTTEGLPISAISSSNGQRKSKLGGKKKQSLNTELLSILESEPGQGGSAPLSGKRNVERLDYKKLHDEAYGNASSDSSDDDEDWSDTVVPSERRERTGEVGPTSPNGNIPVIKSRTSAKGIKQGLLETESTPKRRSHRKSKFKDVDTSPAKSNEGSSKSGSTGKRARQSPYKRLGEAATQGLYKSFREDQYPNRATKESLARELGITFQQVSKWFENARWSFNHSDASIAKSASEKDTSLARKNMKSIEPGPETLTKGTICNGARNEESSTAGTAVPERCRRDVRDSELVTQGSRRQKLTIENSKKRKRMEETQPKSRETKTVGRIQTRSKSVA